MRLSDVFDIPLVLKNNNGQYFELKFEGYALEQPSDFPVLAIVKKGDKIDKKELSYYNG